MALASVSERGPSDCLSVLSCKPDNGPVAPASNTNVHDFKPQQNCTGKFACVSWAGELDLSKHRELVSSLYGPGTVASWALITCSVIVSWTSSRNSRRKDSISNDLIATLTLPAIAAGHLICQVVSYPGDRSQILTTMDPDLTPKVASIEAALCVCDTFCLIALGLAVISMVNCNPKRFLSVAAVGLFCFGAETALFLISPLPSLNNSNLSRPFFLSDRATAYTAITIISILLCLTALFSISAYLRPGGLVGKDNRTQRPDRNLWYGAVSRRDRRADAMLEAQRSKRLEVQLRHSTSTALILYVIAMFTSGFPSLAYNLGAWGITAIGSLHPAAWRLRFFIPESNVGFLDLDQMVAFAGGLATLFFSVQDAVKSYFRETDDEE